MFYYTVFRKELSIRPDEVSLFTYDIKKFTNEKRAIIYALVDNFLYIEENDYFYDEEDQYQNNYFFKDTPQSKLSKYNLKWETPQILEEFNTLYDLSLNKLYEILFIQKDIITPKCEKNCWLYSHNYTNLKKYNCKSLNKL